MDLSHIQSKIYTIRGYKVMLDFDLAETYGIENKYLKRAVRHNIKRFEGDDFMFELTKDEFSRLQIVTLNKDRVGEFEVQKLHLKQRGGIRYMPFAFTELGVAMLSSVLNSETAIETNRKIMRAFVAVRQLILNPPIDEVKELQNEVHLLKQHVEDVFTDYNDINEDTRKELDQINQSLSVANKQFCEMVLLFRHLQKENAFWGYDPASVSLRNMDDDMLIEKVMLHLDIDDINRLFTLYPKTRIKKVWKTRLCPLEPYYNGLNRLYAYMYFDIKNPDRYIKAQSTKHIKELSLQPKYKVDSNDIELFLVDEIKKMNEMN